MIAPSTTILANEFVTLKPIAVAEAPAYVGIGQDQDIWNYLPNQPLRSAKDALAWIQKMQQRSGTDGSVTFSVYDNHSGALAGSSSYLDIRTPHGGLEIGFTWYGKAFQRTHVNSATKLALLTHAFDQLHAQRVQLQTDARNLASQRAIARIGAQREGTLRKHKICVDGFVRDSVVFSITIQDWPAVCTKLQQRLATPTLTAKD